MKSKTKNKSKRKSYDDDIDVERLNFFMGLSVKEKLDYLAKIESLF